MIERTRATHYVSVALAAFVVVTGSLPVGIQSLVYGVASGSSYSFSAYLLSLLALDVVRLAPLWVLRRGPHGLLHPITFTFVLWPLVVNLPYIDQSFSAAIGLLAGWPVAEPYLIGVAHRSPSDIWVGLAYGNVLQVWSMLVAWITFASIALDLRKSVESNRTGEVLRASRLVPGTIIVLAAGIALAFIATRGGFTAHLENLAAGRFQSLEGVGWLITLTEIGVVAAMFWIATYPEDARNPFFIAAVIVVMATHFLVDGSRSGALLAAILVGVTWSVRTKQLPWRVAVVSIPLLLTAYGAMTVVRNTNLYDESSLEAVRSLDLDELYAIAYLDTQARAAARAAAPVLMEGIERTDGLLLGATYSAAIAAAVPRALWEGKPRGPGSLYAQKFLGESPEGLTIPIGGIAEAYWNFGILGVILAAVIQGLAFRIGFEYFTQRQLRPVGIVLYTILLTCFAVDTYALVKMQQQILQLCIVAAVAAASLALRPRPRLQRLIGS